MSLHLSPWIKASRSTSQGQCVEMRRLGAAVQVRDTKQHGEGPVLSVPRRQFAALIDAAKRGELDHLT